MISFNSENNLECKNKHCIFESYDILISFINYVVLTLEEIKQSDNFFINKIRMEKNKYTNFVNEYLDNDKFRKSEQEEKQILLDLQSVFEGELFKNHDLVNCFDLAKIKLQNFNYILKLKLHENKHFRVNYLFKYSNYISSLNHKDIEDLIFSHDEFKNLIKQETINETKIKYLKSQLILITINLLFKSNEYTETVTQSNGNSNSPMIKRLRPSKYNGFFTHLLKSFDESLIENSYIKLFNERIKITRGLNIIIEKIS